MGARALLETPSKPLVKETGVTNCAPLSEAEELPLDALFLGALLERSWALLGSFWGPFGLVLGLA